MTIFIGNLNREVREEELSTVFSKYGEVKQVKIIKDSFSGESKGFAFVDMIQVADANAAITGLNDTELAGRTISVSPAKPRATTNSQSSGNRYRNNSDSFNKNYNY